MEAEKRRWSPRIRRIGPLGVKFNSAQVVGRCVSVLYELATLAFIASLYSYWRSDPTTRVDVLFPSFFPVVFGVMADTYEVVSLLFLTRKRAINPVAVGFDVAMIATGIFCFLVLSMIDRGPGKKEASWARDMTNAMAFMIAFIAIHAGFIILAAGGVVSMYFSTGMHSNDVELARSQAAIVRFNEGQRQSTPAGSGMTSTIIESGALLGEPGEATHDLTR